MYESFFVKFGALFTKILPAVVGSVLALVLSQDIDQNGNMQFTKKIIMKLTVSIFSGMYIGTMFIEYYGIHEQYSQFFQSAILFLVSTFSLLLIGILYQSLNLLRGKSFVEIVKEISNTISAIIRR